MKTLTISRFFPATHPKKGEPTYFVEKIMKSYYPDYENNLLPDLQPKHHTIRKGNRWKVGDKASLRYWTGKPYCSPQKEFAQIEIVEVKKIKIYECFGLFVVYINDKIITDNKVGILAQNDGLSYKELKSWFFPKNSKHTEFTGQIICWNHVTDY